MASLNSVGLVGMIELGRFTQLPIHAHRNGWGYPLPPSALGWSYVAWQKIWRLAGADHMHVNGLAEQVRESDESVIASARACLTPMFDAQAVHRDAGVLVRPVGAGRLPAPTRRSARPT